MPSCYPAKTPFQSPDVMDYCFPSKAAEDVSAGSVEKNSGLKEDKRTRRTAGNCKGRLQPKFRYSWAN